MEHLDVGWVDGCKVVMFLCRVGSQCVPEEEDPPTCGLRDHWRAMRCAGGGVLGCCGMRVCKCAGGGVFGSGALSASALTVCMPDGEEGWAGS